MADPGPEALGRTQTPAGALVLSEDGDPRVPEVSGAPRLPRFAGHAARPSQWLPVLDLSVACFPAPAGR